jgi:hypothetical protein
MWIAHLNQTGGLQGLYNVRCDDLADIDLGAGSGWQQSRTNLGATCSDEILSSIVLSAQLLGCHLSTPLFMSAELFLWHAVHYDYLGNAPTGRLQVYGVLDQQCQQNWPKTSARERTCSRPENQTDSDVRLGWFQHEGFAAPMPKPTCRIWSGISMPKSFPLTGSSTPVPSGNGGEENCI